MLILIVTACAEILALVLRLTARKNYAAGALAAGALPALGQMTADFAQHAGRGTPLTESDWQFLFAELAVFALALLSLWRFSRALFWAGWLVNLGLTAVFVYVVLFWHAFA